MEAAAAGAALLTQGPGGRQGGEATLCRGDVDLF